MGNKDFTIPTLSEGVSQEPISIRGPYHLEEQINGLSSKNRGLIKRNGSILEGIVTLEDSSTTSSLTDISNNNTSVKTLKVKGVDGEDLLVQLYIYSNSNVGTIYLNYLSGPLKGTTQSLLESTYLKGTVEDFKIIMDNNKIIILNKSIPVVGEDKDNKLFANQGSVINVTEGYSNTDYSAEIRLFSGDKKTLHGVIKGSTTTTTDPNSIKTTSIAEALKVSLRADQIAKVGASEKLEYLDVLDSHIAEDNFLHIRLKAGSNSNWSGLESDGASTYVLVSDSLQKETTIRTTINKGLTWTDVVTSPRKEYTKIIYFNNTFYVAATDGTFGKSTDGLTWTFTATIFSGKVSSITKTANNIFFLDNASKSNPNEYGGTSCSFKKLLSDDTVVSIAVEWNMTYPYGFASSKTSRVVSKYLYDIGVTADNKLILTSLNNYSYVVNQQRTYDREMGPVDIADLPFYGSMNMRIAYNPTTLNRTGYYIDEYELQTNGGVASRIFRDSKLVSKSIIAEGSTNIFCFYGESSIVYKNLGSSSILFPYSSSVLYATTNYNYSWRNASSINMLKTLYKFLSSNLLATIDGNIIEILSNLTSTTVYPTRNKEKILELVREAGIDTTGILLTNSSIYTIRDTGALVNSTAWVEQVNEITETFYLEAIVKSSRPSAIKAINRVISDINILPQGPVGYNIKVEDLDKKSNYYLEYDASNAIWREVKKKGLDAVIQKDTLPLLIKDITNNYTVNEFIDHIEIENRVAGDEISNPLPAFINSKIKDILIFNNRLGFLSGPSISLSKIDKNNTFFREATSQLLTDDRIELKADLPSSRRADLLYAIPFENQLVITSETAQYSLKTNNAFDPNSSSLSPLSEYNIFATCPPINLGQSIYLPIRNNISSAIAELSKNAEKGITVPLITSHIPTYLKGYLRSMEANATQGIVFSKTKYNNAGETTDDTLFVQNRQNENGQLTQNAWHKWIFYGEDVLGYSIIDNKLYITTVDIDDRSKLFTQSLEFSPSEIGSEATTNIQFDPLIDRRVFFDQTQIDTITGDLIVEDLELEGYYINPTDSLDVVAIDSRGQIFKGKTAINNKYQALKGGTGGKLWVGYLFDHSFTFSKQVPANYSNGKVPHLHAKMLIRNVILSFENTSKFDFSVKPKGREALTQQFSGMILGDESAILGRINMATGSARFMVGASSDEVLITVSSNYPYPSNFNTAEFQVSLIQRSGRL